MWLQRGNNETQGEVGRGYGGGNATLNCIKTVQRMGRGMSTRNYAPLSHSCATDRIAKGKCLDYASSRSSVAPNCSSGENVPVFLSN